MIRMWINQPSTLQPYHHLHGRNVWAGSVDNNWRACYFVDYEVDGVHGGIKLIRPEALSNGWLDRPSRSDLRAARDGLYEIIDRDLNHRRADDKQEEYSGEVKNMGDIIINHAEDIERIIRQLL